MRTVSRFLFPVLILALLSPGATGLTAQSPPPLFGDGKPGVAPKNKPIKPWRARKAKLHLESLGADAVFLNLFDTVERVVHKTKVDRPGPDRMVWHGRTDDGGAATFAVVKGVMTGTVFLDGQSFEITPDGDGEYTIAELNPAAFPAEDGPMDAIDLQAAAGDEGSGAASVNSMAAGDGVTEMAVMVLWTPAARSAAGGSTAAIESLVLAAVANANQTYVNSLVNARLNLVHSGEVSFSEGGIQNDLPALTTNGDGVLDVVHSLRQQHGADIVTLLGSGYTGQGYCGIGYLMQSPTTAFTQYAFNVVDQSCAAGNLSYAHEVGHNQGLQHDTANAGSTPSYPYAYGYQDPGGAFRTVMSYGGAPRVQHLSNPSVSYNGRVTGTANQNNAQALNNTAGIVAAFKSATGGTNPPPPCTFSASPTSLSFGSTGGTLTVAVTTQSGCAWSASTGASWLSTGTGATGSGSVNVSANTNTGSARNGSVTVAGVTVSVSQAAAAPAPPACTYSVSPTSLSFAASGESKSVTVTTQSGCAWTVAPPTAGWLSVAGGGSGSGTATVTAAQNNGTSRSASVSVAGTTVSASQGAPSKGKGNGKR